MKGAIDCPLLTGWNNYLISEMFWQVGSAILSFNSQHGVPAPALSSLLICYPPHSLCLSLTLRHDCDACTSRVPPCASCAIAQIPLWLFRKIVFLSWCIAQFYLDRAP